MENTHGILVRAIGATNTKPSRILLKSQRFPKNKVYINAGQYVGDSIYFQAANYLRFNLGHDIRAFNEVINADGTTYGYVLHSDTFERII